MDETARAYFTEKHLQEETGSETEKPVKTVTVGVKVDTAEIEAATEKAERLVKLLTEVKRLIGDLTSMQVEAVLEVKDEV